MLLPTKQVAEKLGVHPATVRRWTAAGRLRFVRVGRERAVPLAEVRRVQRSAAKEQRVAEGGPGRQQLVSMVAERAPSGLVLRGSAEGGEEVAE